MKELISKVSLTSLIILYLFFCGTLYLISYWSTFDFDITNYIDLLDIPKSFVYPFSSVLGITFIGFLFQIFHGLLDKNEKGEKKKDIIAMQSRWNRRMIVLGYLSLIVLFICALSYKPRREWVIGLLSLTVAIYTCLSFATHESIIKKFPFFIVRLLISLLVFCVPIFSFSLGKLNSIAVWKNRSYFQVSTIKMTDTSQVKELISTKLLGKLGNHIFLSDTLNSKIIFLNMDHVKSIEYKFVEKKP